MGMVVIGGLLITAIYWALQRKVVPQIKTLREKKKKQKAKMSVGESFAFLAASPYIRDLAMLVVAYGISINLVEVTWKSKIKAQVRHAHRVSSSCCPLVWFAWCLGIVSCVANKSVMKQVPKASVTALIILGLRACSCCSSPTPTTTLPSWASSPPPPVL
jgi:ATP/ADP translocase